MGQSEFEAALAKFRRLAEDMVNAYFAKLLPGKRRYILTIERDGRYVKIVWTERGMPGGSAWAFVDSKNGDILQADARKRSAKGARGNIFDVEPLAAVNPYGANDAPRGKK